MKGPIGKSLKFFILSSQSIQLYRELIKTVRKIPDQSTQTEIMAQIKE